jgi:hypothetical protein
MQKRSELMESSWTSFHLEIKKLTRDTVDMDHMQGFLLMTHVSKRQGVWSSVTEYLMNFSDILQDSLNDRIKVTWFTETSLLEIIWSARGLNRARPLAGDWSNETIIYLDMLDLDMKACRTLVEGQDVNNNPKRTDLEKQLLTLMLYNQDILHTIKSCFAFCLRSFSTEQPSDFDICSRKFQRLQDRLEILEQDTFFQQLKIMDRSFTSTIFHPYTLNLDTAFATREKFPGWTDIDPVEKDLRALFRDEEMPPIPDDVMQSMEWFKSTTGGLRRLFWTRYFRNIILSNILRYFILGVPMTNGEATAAKLIVMVTECAMYFSLSYMYMVEMALYGYSLAELQIRSLNVSPDAGITILYKVNLIRNISTMDFSVEGEGGRSTI